MNKTELTKLAKSLVLPEGWIVQAVYPKHRGKKHEEIAENNHIIFGYPIQDRMSDSSKEYKRKIELLEKQLNGSKKRGEKKWVEFGGGYGGGKWYDVDFGINC